MLEAIILAAMIERSGVKVDAENFFVQSGIATIVMKITNNSGRDLNRVFIDCSFLDRDGKAIDVGPAMVDDIQNGSYRRAKASIANGAERVKHAECDIRYVQP